MSYWQAVVTKHSRSPVERVRSQFASHHVRGVTRFYVAHDHRGAPYPSTACRSICDTSADTDDAWPQKRTHTTEDAHQNYSDVGNLQLERHEEFWFDNGSIVLVAQQKTGFPVYRALLAAQSTIFADMFVSSNPITEDMIEGCPGVTYLTPRRTLRISSRPPAQVSAIVSSFTVRTTLHYYALNACHLSGYVPANPPIPSIKSPPSSASRTNTTSKTSSTRPSSTYQPTSPATSTPGRATACAECRMSHLAGLIDRPALLPVAFYRCALLGGDVVSGYRREDKAVDYLRRRDLKRGIDGRNELAEQAASVLTRVFGDVHPCEPCASRDRCRGALLLLDRVVDDEFAAETDVLTSWEGRILEWVEDLDLCDPCKRAVVVRDRAARRQVRDELPSIFGLTVEGWARSEDGGEATESETA